MWSHLALLSSRQTCIQDSSSDCIILILCHQLSDLNKKPLLCHSFHGSGVGTQLGCFLCSRITGLQWKCHRTLMVPQTQHHFPSSGSSWRIFLPFSCRTEATAFLLAATQRSRSSIISLACGPP